MIKKLAAAVLSLLFTVTIHYPSLAETVVEKVAKTGVLTAGTRTDAIPFAYVNEQGELIGYSVDILRLIREQLEKVLGREVVLELVEVNVSDRIPKLINREVDIVCGAASFTWERNQYIDFSISYAIVGTQFLVKQGSNINLPESLEGSRIGVIPQTTSEQLIKLLEPEANLVVVNNRPEGLTALETNQIDALASDGILLEGLRQTLANPDDFMVIPEQPLNREGIACMIPEDDSEFTDLVNYTLVQFMQGFLLEEREAVALINRWFGLEGVINIEKDTMINFFQYIIDSHEQIPLR